MDQGIGRKGTTSRAGAGIADYIFLMRPTILLPVWTFYLLGAWHGNRAAGSTGSGPAFAWGIVSFTALLGAVYIINQITDRESDRRNRKLFLLADGIVTLRAAWAESALLMAVSLACGFFLLPRPFLIVLLASLALGAAYSLEPVRLKKRPFADVLANAAGSGLLNTLAGWTASGAPLSGLQVLLPYPPAVAAVHLAAALADAEGDVSSGLRTSAVLAGKRRGAVIAAALMAAASAAAYITGNRPALYATLISLPAFIIPARVPSPRLTAPGVLFPAKVATLVFSMTAGFLFPAFIPAVAAVILLSRLYYSRRFGIEYPSL